MTDKQFIVDSIKMDIHRVVTAAGDITKKLPEESIREFLEHANKNFNKIPTTQKEKSLRNTLKKLSGNLDSLQDPHKRLRWAEDIMTIRCRL